MEKSATVLFKEDEDKEEEFFVRRLVSFLTWTFFLSSGAFPAPAFVSKKGKFWAGHLKLITHLDLKHLPFWKSLHMGCDVCLIESKRSTSRVTSV